MEDLKNKSKILEKRISNVKKQLEKELNATKVDYFELDDGSEKILTVRRSECSSIRYDAEKVRKRLKNRKDVLKRVLDIVVVPSKIEEEFDKGNIKLKDLEGTFEIKKSYKLTVQRVKRRAEEEKEEDDNFG